MTTASRPTFAPVLGKGESGYERMTSQFSSKDQPSHRKLKYRSDPENRTKNVRDSEMLEIELNKELDEEELELEPVEDIDEELLLAELEKIKEERRFKKKEIYQESHMERVCIEGEDMGFRVKRRWDDDAIFRNQGLKEKRKEKQFVNDMIRSDFHKKFMNKYIK